MNDSQETYDKQEAKRINNLPDSKLGEGGPFLEFDIGRVTYGGKLITEAGYDGRSIYIQYETPDGWDDHDYLSFPTHTTANGTIVVMDYPAGLLTAEEVYETHTEAPHARSLEPVYDALSEAGVMFKDMDDVTVEPESEESVEDTLGLEEGDSLWRFAALKTWQSTIGEQDPDKIINELATALADDYPDAVNGDPVNIVEANLKGTPGIYTTDLIQYHAMEVNDVSTSGDQISVTIIDWKEEKRYVFESSRDEAEEREYYTFEPLSALKKHLGVTILPVTDE